MWMCLLTPGATSKAWHERSTEKSAKPQHTKNNQQK